mmetsp:Transcript_58982/g.138217  ORF Transcript_58982/g.138217 Transcript_58982/m.138217 type:complete len:202 (-) Transcript_58982:471-1076(-)
MSNCWKTRSGPVSAALATAAMRRSVASAQVSWPGERGGSGLSGPKRCTKVAASISSDMACPGTTCTARAWPNSRRSSLASRPGSTAKHNLSNSLFGNLPRRLPPPRPSKPRLLAISVGSNQAFTRLARARTPGDSMAKAVTEFASGAVTHGLGGIAGAGAGKLSGVIPKLFANSAKPTPPLVADRSNMLWAICSGMYGSAV